MSVQTVNGHVLIPNLCDWGNSPTCRRTWQNEIAQGLTGKESRQSVRAHAREGLSFEISTSGATDTSKLVDRLSAAKRSGLAVVPFFGRGSAVSALAGDTEISIPDVGAVYVVGGYLFFSEDDVHEITSASLSGGVWAVEIDDALTGDASQVWPAMFGKFECGEINHLSTSAIRVEVTVTELTSFLSAQIGAVTPSGDEDSLVGTMVIDTDLIV